MLRIIQMSNAARAKSYYSTADYYTEGQELVGHWHGKGARRLGLFGTIAREDWDRLCDNERPGRGEPLTVRTRSERRVGYDMNFHAPKSVSLLYGLTRDDRIVQAFRDSVNATMDEIEAEAKARVRSSGRDEDRTTGNLAWGEFVHFSARPEDGVPDPHLHSHCVVFNATYDQEEDRWKAAQLGDIKRDAPYFEAVFHARLARKLEELGLATTRTAKGWELEGVTRETLAKFSRRTARIEKIARERGITDPKIKAELGAITRSGKAKQLTMPELDGLWRARLTEPESAVILGLTQRIGSTPVGEDREAAAGGVDRAMKHSFERASVLPERKLLTEALRQSVGKASRGEIESLVARQPIIHATRDGRRLVTTHDVLEEESRMLAFARSGRGACRPLNLGRRAFQREWLNAEQRAAVRHVLESRDRVVIVRGRAGTGKTTMMQEAREAIEAAGTRVFAFAPSAGASRDVLRRAGFPDADTVARLLADTALQAELKGSVIWIDEAGLIGSQTIRQVFDLAEHANARVVLSGDVRQHGSVQRGAVLRLLEEEAGLMPAEITEIQRQKDRYKAAMTELGEGRTEAGFNALDKLGWIREVAGDDRYQTIASAYLSALADNKSALVVSPTRAEGERITEEIRGRMRQQGLLAETSHAFEQLVPRQLTLGQRQDAVMYEQGDVMLFHQNARGHRKGTRLVVGHTPLPLDQAERFAVFRPRQIELAAGDRIRITQNGRTRDGEHRLNNGDIFTVKDFTPEGDLLLGNGWTLQRDYGHLDYGLVVTSHASQGKTVDRVIVGQSSLSFPASSQEQFYVSASRGREQVLVFTDDKHALLQAVSRNDERLSGTELVQGTRRDRDRQPELEPAVPASMPSAEREEIDHER